MKRSRMAVGLILLLPSAVFACLWDRDTPADEAEGMPEVVAVLTGRFARNPPLFYEMRLSRVSLNLQTHPGDLAAYDDAGVASDRLGRGDEAVAWMERKKTQLDMLDATRPEVKEHLYRYHANLGTFLVHRWVRTGSDRSKLDEVKASREQIAKALKINPNAHFGREKYQLMAIDWIIRPLPSAREQYLPNLLGLVDPIFRGRSDPERADEAVRGLSGLIVLGNAWESVDIFNALDMALQNDKVGFPDDRNGGRNTLAYLAWLRCCELIDDGKVSILPDAPRGEDLKAKLPRPDFVDPELLKNAFVMLRAEAIAWQSARTAFMMKRLTKGLHPDVDPDFWAGYRESPAPGLPTKSLPDDFQERQTRKTRIILAEAIAIPIVLIGIVVGLARYFNARDRRRFVPSVSTDSHPPI